MTFKKIKTRMLLPLYTHSRVEGRLAGKPPLFMVAI